MFFFKNHAEIEAGRLFSGLFFQKKVLYEMKASGQQFIFNIFCQSSTWHIIKTNCIKLQIRSILEKGLGVGSSPHFVYHFSRKLFLMLYSINLPNFIALLPLLLEILFNMCIAIVCQPGCDVMNSGINLVFQSKPFFYMTKNARQRFKHLENEKSF